ncbi:hypothetical protein PG994_005372 [Apiospora phragmitis]|uniref:Uncharacterized protein n=1 Tax=Apiospora phragmitis TaxID=2905665 RepID=A0ABR1VC25_9PEZI
MDDPLIRAPSSLCYGKKPPGHPGNTVGLPGYDQGNNQPPQQKSNASRSDFKKPGGFFSSLKSGKAKEEQKAPKAAESRRAASSSARKYAQVPRMGPYDPIPLTDPGRSGVGHLDLQERAQVVTGAGQGIRGQVLRLAKELVYICKKY